MLKGEGITARSSHRASSVGFRAEGPLRPRRRNRPGWSDVGQDIDAGVGDGDGVLKMRGGHAVHRENRPAILVEIDISAAHDDHGFYGEGHAAAEGEVA